MTEKNYKTTDESSQDQQATSADQSQSAGGTVDKSQVVSFIAGNINETLHVPADIQRSDIEQSDRSGVTPVYNEKAPIHIDAANIAQNISTNSSNVNHSIQMKVIRGNQGTQYCLMLIINEVYGSLQYS